MISVAVSVSRNHNVPHDHDAIWFAVIWQQAPEHWSGAPQTQIATIAFSVGS